MEIDIRNPPKQEMITNIRFADSNDCEATLAVLIHRESSGAARIEDDCGEYVRIANKEHAQNLIKAIEFAIKEWFLK